jgi:hypothetical protein
MKKQYVVLLGLLAFLVIGGVVYLYDTYRPPKIISHPVSLNDTTEFLSNKGYLYHVKAVGRKGETLTFNLLTAPDGMQIDPGTGRIFWIPTLKQTGVHAVEVQVSDKHGRRATQHFYVEFDPTTLHIQAPQVVLRVVPNNAITGETVKITLSTSGWLDIKDIELKVADTAISPTTAVVPNKTLEYVYTPESIGEYHILGTVWDMMGNTGTAEERLQVKGIGMTVEFIEGIDAEQGSHEKDPTILSIGTRSDVKDILLPCYPDGRAMLDFSPSVDFYFGYTDGIPVFTAYQPSVTCALLKGVVYRSVNTTQLDMTSLKGGYAQHPMSPADTVIFHTGEGNYYKLGNVHANIEEGKISFSYERLQP